MNPTVQQLRELADMVEQRERGPVIPASDMTRAEARKILFEHLTGFDIDLKERHRAGEKPSLQWYIRDASKDNYSGQLWLGETLREAVGEAVSHFLRETAKSQDAVAVADASDAELREIVPAY